MSPHCPHGQDPTSIPQQPAAGLALAPAASSYEGDTHHDSRIVGSTFTGNAVGIFGGAIVGEGTVPNPHSSMLIDDCTFDSNYSAFEGGAIVFDSLKTTVRHSRFNNNFAKVSAGALATTNVVDTFVYGLQVPPVYPFPKFETAVVDCEFDNNVAEGDEVTHDEISGAFGVNFARGGGALVTYLNGYLNVVHSTFRANVAMSGEGGAILNGYSDAANVFGSGVNVYDVETTVVSSTFIGNEAWDGTVHGSKYESNLPDHIYGIDSIINGSSATPYVK